MNNQETFIISLKDKQFLTDLIGVDKKADQTKGKINSLSGSVSSLRNAFAGISIAFLGREIVTTLSDFERFEAVLTNTLGSNSAAQKALSDINTFAAETPFAVNQLTDAYVKLTNQGFQPSIKEMTKLGDLASSTGKDFDQLAEAIIDGQVGEFERLKEFGIRAKKQGDQVTFTFKGVETQVGFTEKEMRKYLVSLGDVNGVSGAMAAISKTTGGQISNLGDQVTQLYLKIGKKLKPIISGTIKVMGEAIVKLSSFSDWLTSGSDGADFFNSSIAALAAGMLTYKLITEGVAIATKIYTAVQWALNVALDANPIGIVVVAVAALVAGIYTAWNQSEKFRAVIIGLWEAHKALATGIYKLVKPAIDFLADGFTTFKDRVVADFLIVKDFVMGVFNDIFEFVKPIFDFISKVSSDLLGDIDASGVFDGVKDLAKDVGEAFRKGATDELKRSRDEQAKQKAEEDAVSNINGFKTGIPKIGQGIGKSGAIGKGLSEIKAGAPKTFNINIESLIKEQTFNTNNLSESRMKIKEAVVNAMLTAVNDAQVISE